MAERKKTDIVWHNYAMAGLEYEYKGIKYRKGSNQCVFNIGDLVLPSSPITVGMEKRMAGIILDMIQADDNTWPQILVLWPDGTEKLIKSRDLWRIVQDGQEENG